MAHALNDMGQASYQHFDEVVNACANELPQLGGIIDASPRANFRSRALKLPRQTHRYSGRTAMRSNLSVHEPKQPQDDDSPLAFSMEGDSQDQPGSLLPFSWSPGWNSNQSIHKFQVEPGGPLVDGTAGIRLLDPAARVTESNQQTEFPSQFVASSDQWLLIPTYRVFGSDEMSAHTPAFETLIDAPFVMLTTAVATHLRVSAGDFLTVGLPDHDCCMQVKIDDTVPSGCVAYSVGVPGAHWLPANTRVELSKTNEEDT